MLRQFERIRHRGRALRAGDLWWSGCRWVLACMNDDSFVAELRCLADWKLSARIDVGQTGKVLGFAASDVPILMRAGLLKPLGSPAANSVKFFAAIEVLKLALDRAWLSQATKVVGRYWKHKRLRRQGAEPTGDLGVQNMPEKARKVSAKPSAKSSLTERSEGGDGALAELK